MTQRRAVTQRDVGTEVLGGVDDTAARVEGWVGGACIWAVGEATGVSVGETLNSL